MESRSRPRKRSPTIPQHGGAADTKSQLRQFIRRTWRRHEHTLQTSLSPIIIYLPNSPRFPGTSSNVLPLGQRLELNMALRIPHRPALRGVKVHPTWAAQNVRGMKMLHPPKFENEPFVNLLPHLQMQLFLADLGRCLAPLRQRFPGESPVA